MTCMRRTSLQTAHVVTMAAIRKHLWRMTMAARAARALMREVTGLIWWTFMSVALVWVTVHALLQGDLVSLLELLAAVRPG